MFPQSWLTTRHTALTNVAETVVLAAGHFGGYFVYNPNASAAVLQLYDSAGTVVVGTTTPKCSFTIPAGAGANLEIIRSLYCTAGIQIAATTTATGGTAPASPLVANIWYH